MSTTKYCEISDISRHNFDTYAYAPIIEPPALGIKFITLVLKFVQEAFEQSINISRHQEQLSDSIYYNIYPNEHYRLLKAIVKTINPKIVIDIGTFTGMSCFAMLQSLRFGSVIHTYDLVQCNESDNHLDRSMFEDGLIIQHLCDLSDINTFNSSKDLLNSADIIFMDGPKDNVFEYKFLNLLSSISKKSLRILVIDDIKFKDMLPLWHCIKSPKIDLTSFGHWSGTGLVDISDGLTLM